MLIKNGIVPPKEWVINPSKLYYYLYKYIISCKTIAMMLASKG